jgi:asparagine synthetase B (glutamine-hydrolysing)
MCGIAGYMVTDSKDPRIRLAITILGLKQADRGVQSWGMMYGTPGVTPLVHRVASSIERSFDLPKRLSSAMAVHTRHATTGTIKTENAHPFTKNGPAGEVIGMHNGMIDNHEVLGLRYKREYSVDSEHIFAQIADGLPLQEIEGYGTVVYTLDNKWFIGTFNGGELAFAITELGVFYASELRALEHSLDLAQIPVRQLQWTKDGNLYAITPEGLEYVDNSLSIVAPTFVSRWQDGKIDLSNWKGARTADDETRDEGMMLDPTQDTDDDLPEDVIHFYSDGCVCDACGEPTAIGDDMFYVESVLYCELCYEEIMEEEPK